jgi:hypothetical protein
MKVKTKYFIDYVYNQPSGANYYHTLVRTRDNAILFSNPNLQLVIGYAKEIQGINSKAFCIL